MHRLVVCDVKLGAPAERDWAEWGRSGGEALQRESWLAIGNVCAHGHRAAPLQFDSCRAIHESSQRRAGLLSDT